MSEIKPIVNQRNPRPITEAKTKDLHFVEIALRRAEQLAIDTAQRTNTPLVVQENGKMVLKYVN